MPDYTSMIYPVCPKIKECKALQCYFCKEFSHFEPKIKTPDPKWREILRKNRRRGKYAEHIVTKRWRGARRVQGSGSGDEKGDILYGGYLFQEKASVKDDAYYFLLRETEAEAVEVGKEDKKLYTPLIVLECGDELILALDGDDFARFIAGEPMAFYAIRREWKSHKVLFKWLNKARRDCAEEYSRSGIYYMPGVIRFYSRHHKGKMVVFVERLYRKEEDNDKGFAEITGDIVSIEATRS